MIGYLVAVALGLFIPATIAIIKRVRVLAVRKSLHHGVQTELTDLKVEIKTDATAQLVAMDKRFDKLESLFDRLWDYERLTFQRERPHEQN